MRKRLQAGTRAALFAEWKKFSPSIESEGTEREARLDWTAAALAGKADSSPSAQNDSEGAQKDGAKRVVDSWSKLTEGEARYLLRRLREESGDGPAYRAGLIARLAAELWGAPWDRLLSDRLAARFRVRRAEDLSPRDAHAEIEELISRIARRDGIETEQLREKLENYIRDPSKGEIDELATT